MNMAIITPFPITSPGGVENFTSLLVEILESAGNKVTLFDITLMDESNYTGVFDIKKLGQYRLSYDLANEFNRQKDKFDLVICNGMYGWNVKFPKVITIAHGNIGDYADSSRKGMSALSYFKTRYIDVWFQTMSFRKGALVAVSASTGHECEKYNKISDYTVIENTVNENKFMPRGDRVLYRERFGLPDDAFLGLFVGRPEYRKGIDIVKNTAALLEGQHKIVAAVPVEGFHAPNIIPITNIPHKDIPYLYNACDYFFLPSRHEGCSIALLEALASGLPVITTTVGNASGIAKADSVMGAFIFDTYDPVVYLHGINRLAKDHNLRRELGNRARMYVLEHNITDIFKDKYLKLINLVMRQND